MKQIAQLLAQYLKSNLLPATSSGRPPWPHFAAFLGVVALAMTSATAWGTVLFTEDFNYTAGDNITNHSWTVESGYATNPLKAQSPGLTYSGYLSSEIGLGCPM